MRGRFYHGALASFDGALALIALHPAEEVVPLRMLERPQGPTVTAGERKLAEQLVASLDGPFEPEKLRDEFRERVLAFVKAKAMGKKLRVAEEPRPRAVSDLAGALERSLARVAKKSDVRSKERRVA
jgi:DNA end-binding protein Ku